jgi:hypothetical protein
MTQNDLAQKTSRQQHIILALILTLGAVLRIVNLNMGFFGDELHTIRVAYCYPLAYIISNNWGSFFYQVLVHFLLPLGSHEIVARIPAVIFGILGIYALFLLTRRLFGKKEALFAAAYLAVLPFHIYWSQTARGYSAFLLFSLLALFFFLESIKDNRLSAWAGYIAFSVLAAYTHLFYLSCLASHAAFEGILFLLGLKKTKQTWAVDKKHIAGFVLCLIVIGAIIFVLYYPDLTRGSGIERITLHSKFSKQIRPIDTNIGLFFQLIHQTFIWVTQSWRPVLFLVALLSGFFIIGVIASIRKQQSQLILIILSIAIPVALFLYGGPSDSTVRNAPDRYLTYLLPFFLILISKGILTSSQFLIKTSSRIAKKNRTSQGERQLTNAGMIIIFFLLCVLLLPQVQRIYHYRQSQPDFKGALQYVNSHMDADALLVFEGTFLLFFEDSNIRDGLPVYIDGYYEHKNPLLSKYDIIENLKELPSQKREVWSIVYIPEKEHFNRKSSSSSTSFQKIAVIPYQKDTLQSNFTKLFTDLLDLRKDNREDYLLTLALLYLNQNNTEKAKDILQSLGELDAYKLPGQENLKPGWASHTLSKRQQMYARLSRTLFSQGEYKGSIFAFLRFSERLVSSNRIEEAVNSLEKYLTRKVQKEDKAPLVNQFLRPIPFDEGLFFIWRDPEGWHIRWKAKKDTRLHVSVESSSKIRGVKKTLLEDSAALLHKPRSLAYETQAQENRIVGFDFQVKSRSKLTFDLSLNQKNIQKVFYTRKDKIPLEKVPEGIKVYKGKSGRTTLFIN